MVPKQINLRIGFLSILLVVGLSACTDLSAVRNWATTSLQAAQFNEIITTYADTPERLAFYDRDEAERWKAQSGTRAEQAKALKLQLSLVADYMAALAALSADSATDYSKDVGALTASLKKTGQVPDNTLGAAGKLATTILNAAAKLWQKKKVGALIEQANPSLQSILKGELRSIVDDDFRNDLRVESGILNRHFKDLLRIGGGSSTAKAALNEWFVVRKAENKRRMAAVDAYIGVLGNISEGHQKLFDNADDLNAAQLVKDLYKSAKEIRDNVKEIIKS